MTGIEESKNMPNQRKKGKKLIAGWLESGDAVEFKARADELGVTTTDLLTLLIREELRRNKISNTKRSDDGNANV